MHKFEIIDKNWIRLKGDGTTIRMSRISKYSFTTLNSLSIRIYFQTDGTSNYSLTYTPEEEEQFKEDYALFEKAVLKS